MTRGERLLRAVLQRTTSEDVAARCRVAGQTVRLWAAGERFPTLEHREKLESLYGIPAGAWGARFEPAIAAKSLRS
jgi:transcriptional regulator with XRE-family HTH domain